MNPEEYKAKGGNLNDFKFKNPQSILGTFHYENVFEDILFGYNGD